MAALIDRVKIRLSFTDEERPIIEEVLQTACDRIILRTGGLPAPSGDFPEALASIAVDVTVKAYRRMEYEGINSEGTEGMSTTFVDDILAEYSEELQAYKDNKNSSATGVVMFI